MNRINIGIDIGGTTTNVGIFTGDNKLICKKAIATDSKNSNHYFFQTIFEIIKTLVAQNNFSSTQINSIGVGVPGTADSSSGVVLFAPNINWRNVAVVEPFQNFFKVKVFLAQDSRAAALAEFLVGSGKGYRNIATITLGTGIGCGMIIDGKLFEGGLNTAGEFGHQIVELKGPNCNCGRHGCLETYAGALGILRQSKEIENLEKLVGKSSDQISVKDIYLLSKSGNSDARKITDKVVDYLGMGLVNLINLNSLELVSLCGGIAKAPDELLFEPLKAFVQKRAYAAISEKVKIVKSVLGSDASMIGAALLYKDPRLALSFLP